MSKIEQSYHRIFHYNITHKLPTKQNTHLLLHYTVKILPDTGNNAAYKQNGPQVH